MSLRDFMDPIPVYVTRKNAHNETGTYTLSAWVPLLAMMLVAFNVIAWSIVGLITAVQVVV